MNKPVLVIEITAPEGWDEYRNVLRQFCEGYIFAPKTELEIGRTRLKAKWEERQEELLK